MIYFLFNTVISLSEQDTQVVLLLNEASPPAESPGRSWMMMIQTSDLSFASVSRPTFANLWRLDELKVFIASNTSILLNINGELLLLSFADCSFVWVFGKTFFR